MLLEKNNKTGLEINNGGFKYSITILLFVIFSVLVQTLLQLVLNTNGTPYILLTTFLGYLPLLALEFYFVKKEEKITLNNLGLNKFNLIYLLLIFSITFGMMFGLGFLNDVIAKFFVSKNLNVSNFQPSINTPIELVFFILVLAVIPAIAEELFFRGTLQKGEGALFYAIYNSFLFAIYHGSVSQLAYQFVYGILLSFLSSKTKSVLPCIMSHFINNAVIILFYYFNVQINYYSPVLISLGIVSIIISAFFLIKGNKELKTKKQDKVFYVIASVFGVIMCVLNIILGLMAK